MSILANRRDPATRRPRVTQLRVIRSEWIKFWSLRSTTITLAVAVLLFVGLGLLAASMSASGQLEDGDGPGNPVDLSLAGMNFAQLIVGTLGVLFMAGEYSTGMIRSSLAAVPGRLGVLWGKAMVFAVVTFVLMLVSAFLAFLGGQAILGDSGASLSDPGVVRAIAGSAGYLTSAGLLGLALGALLRSTPAALSTYFGVMFLLSGIVGLLLPESWRDNVGPYLPESAGAAMGAVTRGENELTPWGGLLVLLAYLAIVGGAAAWRLKRQDA
ncbi:ABC transporter permease subunit [Actinoplanes sp. NBRC 103695]|uniref:ABC transporter permease subunit n=1 Tax=Actinoplanes sp. NBRC 103695 TaxID=3032202 RepID=UPI0024A295FB|nr:ABC transporter permease subunit [Actinoplanes sp. NBRC 103695]GLY94098.1 ABC transporter permease [Actinoplanes sp. NBRC 103695]